MTDPWTGGEAYERYMGRWSRLVAAEFVRWLDLPPDGRWLDVGCGTGALTADLVRAGRPAAVIGADPSAAQVAHARSTVRAPRVRFLVGELETLPCGEASKDAVVSGLALNFLPDPAGSLARMAGLCRRGGVVAGYVWDYAEGMRMLRRFWDAAVALDPAAAELDEGPRFPLCRPDALEALFRSAGLAAVETRAIEIEMRFADFDDYWRPFLGGQGPAPAYVASLDERRRRRLAKRLEHDLGPVTAEGIRLGARAWATRGRRVSD